VNTVLIKALIARRGGELVTVSPEWVDRFTPCLGHEDVREYLSECITAEGLSASGMAVKDRELLEEENLYQASPGMYVFDYGYLVIATSVGGNAVCLDGNSGGVVWVDHSSLSDFGVSYKDRETNEWVDLPLDAENLRKALIPLSDDIESFLVRFFGDELTATLDALD
jgi:hypothetical protein